ncbi:DUF502 domain-containing protein [Flavihumibacter petaseus]|uniref:DUF502 domain-containing protein n=1 Tax=Flavihumibacter petaseus NBRC 106054 TaxID=1220578 RepID=A0A0E9MVS6_9BACT|nr:DUF502 domain-containing protein [Flavihumibacter petaseus]GAO41857.1 hypothetical protein FPE01S_01_08720 [Flavihumibacter petaseus NBRC 106054]
MEMEPLKKDGWRWKKVFQYFLQGVLVVAPVAITGYLIFWFVSSIDNLIPLFQVKDDSGRFMTRNYGLGFVVIIAALIVIGYLSSNFITSRIFSLFDHWLERAPGVKFIYTSIKDFFEAFAGNKRKFNKPVAVSLHLEDVYQIGFITDEDASEFGLQGYITVYVPLSYSFAGQTYLVPRHRVRPIDHVKAADAMKYVVSGGVAEPEHEHHKSGKSV